MISVFVIRGHKATLPCATSKTEENKDISGMTWTSKDQSHSVDSRFFVHENGTMDVSDSQPRDTGEYQCTYQNSENKKKQTVYHVTGNSNF